MKKREKNLLCAVLAAGMAVTMAGCAEETMEISPEKKGNAVEISAEADRKKDEEKNQPDFDEQAAGAFTDFAVRLLAQNLEEGENTLVSPLSMLYALGMTANGAEGETRTQMETVLGMTAEELNRSLYAYGELLPEGKKYRLCSANSLWIQDSPDFSAEPEFMQTNADWYGADIYRAPFDSTTVKEINDWVSDHTEKRIPSILDNIPPDSVMYLVNALAFDAEWENIYMENQISERIFTAEDGQEEKVDMMYSEESSYLEDEEAIGFLKYYADKSYAFAAILPKEGMPVSEYVSSLTGEKLQKLLNHVQEEQVNAGIPRFETEYAAEMSKALKNMGMTDAFDDRADFSGIEKEGNLFISQILHKTYFAVDEKETKAAAATAVAMSRGAMMEPPKEVILNRPFVYLLIDCQNRVPVFIGVMRNPA